MFDWLLSPLAPLGRLMLSAIFFLSAVASHIPNFAQDVEKMSKQDVPFPGVALVGAIVFLIAGSVSLALGLKARIGALLLLVFLILATYYFHDFWNVTKAEQMAQMQNFMKNLALGGAMLLVMAVGPGPWSLDKYIERRTAKEK